MRCDPVYPPEHDPVDGYDPDDEEVELRCGPMEPPEGEPEEKDADGLDV